MDFNANVCFVMGHTDIFPYSVASHIHDCFEIVYYVHGEGVSKIGGQEFRYAEHTFCIIPPGTPHEEWARAPTELVYIGFEYDNQMGELPVCLLPDPDGGILDGMRAIRREMELRHAMYEDLLRLYQKSLVIQLRRLLLNNKTCKRNGGKEHLEYSVNFITANCSKQIDLEALANSIGYSYDHFRHLFKSVYGVSPKQFIINTRISKAKGLLSEGAESVETVAQLCGFHSCSQFIVTFKNVVGITPYRYRKTEERYIEKADFLA